MIWTKHDAPFGHDIKPYYMQREDKGSLATHCVIRKRFVRCGRRVTRWALYDLLTRECRLRAHFHTLRDAKAHAAWLAS